MEKPKMKHTESIVAKTKRLDAELKAMRAEAERLPDLFLDGQMDRVICEWEIAQKMIQNADAYRRKNQ